MAKKPTKKDKRRARSMAYKVVTQLSLDGHQEATAAIQAMERAWPSLREFRSTPVSKTGSAGS